MFSKIDITHKNGNGQIDMYPWSIDDRDFVNDFGLIRLFA